MKPAPEASQYFEFDVTLRDVEPPIWRRLQTRTDATFRDLHNAIQKAGGWWDYHLFRFEAPDRSPIAGIPDDEWGEPDPDADQVGLDSYFRDADRCVYLYDFGDGWEHDIRLRQTLTLTEAFRSRLVDGARAFPPEDCGGLPGYEDCVAVARGGPDPAGLREWLGDWDPERFDLKAVAAGFEF